MKFVTIARRWCVAALSVLAVACAPQAPQDAAAPETPLTPIQSPNDSKAYRYITLDNGLRALLISDPSTRKAAASLDVYVGSASNPADRGGLAHFLEHMLFLGTDKYPDSGEYATFISEHGGSRNAYTGFEHTNYFFDIDSDHFEEALDRFAQFFIAPRFDVEYVSREINAVNAEYQMGLNTDGRRNLDVSRELTNPDHPFSILGVGTSETLADRPGAPVRDDLLAFYRKYYSANLMTLVVFGSESLDELETMVTGIFSPVPNHSVDIEDIEAPRIEPERLPLLVYIQPEATARSMTISFAMPNYDELYREKPLVYISNLLGHEGEGSLLSLLKAEGWAEGLGAGSGIAYRGGSEFSISVGLTELGLEQRDQVLRKLFEYLEMLKDAGPREALYTEQGQLAALSFRFRDEIQPIQYVAGLASDMHMLPPADILRGNYLMSDYEPELIQDILQTYFVPGNAYIQIVAQGLPVDRESEFYGTPYSVQQVDLAAVPWGSVGPDDVDPRLTLPALNEFVAENVDVLPLPEANPKVPQQVYAADRLRLWQRQDSKFRIPRGAMYARFRSSVAMDTAEDAAASELYVSLLQDAVNEYTYPAYLAGLNFSIGTNVRGIELSIRGYDDKQLVLLARIVDSIATANLDTHRFDNIRKDLIRGLENVTSARASSQTVRQGRRVLLSGRYPEADLIAALESLTPQEVAAHGERFWNSASVDVLMNGNYSPDDAAAVRAALQPLMAWSLPASLPHPSVVRLKPGDDFIYTASVEHEDSVMLWYLQSPDDSLESRAMAGLTGQVIAAEYFEELRTEQQLGYIGHAITWPLLDVPGIAMLVQSPGASADDVLAASRTFLEARAEPGVVTPEAFARHRSALLQEILKPHKNLWEQSGYFWREISRNNLDFDGRMQIANAVKAVEFEQWQAWYRRYVLDEPASMLIVAPGRWGTVPEAATVIEDAESFRASMPQYQRD